MGTVTLKTRRGFLTCAGTAGAGLMFPLRLGIGTASAQERLEEMEISPVEDLMRENELFGADGFEKVVGEVAGLEKKMGLYDLAQFTPDV